MKAKRALHAIVLLILTSSSSQFIRAQGPSQSATLALTVEPSVVMAGKPLTLDAILTNHSDKQMLLGRSFSCGFDLGLEIDIRDSKGNEPAQTILLRRAKHEDIGPDGRLLNPEHDGRTHICMGSGGLGGVMTNATLKDTVDLSRMYDLTQPGKYTVQVSRVDENHNTFRSNPVEFTVVPNPDYVPEIPCTPSADVIVTVSDPSGAILPMATVLFSPEGRTKEPAPAQQATTGGAGAARASGVPCGFVDIFVAADGFTPYARKVYVGQRVVSLSVVLYPWPQRNPSDAEGDKSVHHN